MTLEYTRDLDEILRITSPYPRYFSIDFEDWLSEDKNVILKQGDNLAFAEYKSPGVYWVHFCFHEARGREAIKLTQDIFDEFCHTRFVKLVIGFIDVENKRAKWLIRQAGFQSLGEMMTENGLCEMFYSTKDLNNGVV